jgi:hypothetical protein
LLVLLAAAALGARAIVRLHFRVLSRHGDGGKWCKRPGSAVRLPRSGVILPWDEANSRKYGDMVENLAKHSQLIVITHNRETMSRAGILYGITMGTDGYSKLLSANFLL